MLLLSTGGIIAIIISAAVVAVAIGIVLFKFVIQPKAYQRQIKELDRKYSYLDALMIGQSSQYIKRLEMISRTNLLYVDIYADFSKRFKHIYDIDDQYAKGVINQLRSLAESKQYRQMKAAILEGKKAVATFEEKANQLDKDLSQLIKPEEEARQVALTLKEKLRDIKQTYSTNILDLAPVANTFDKLFNKLDKKFMEFETLIEGAEYDDANNVLPVIDKVLTQLDSVMSPLPKLCIVTSKVIPEKIKQLKEESETLHSRGYPLHHLMLTNTFANYEERIEKINEALVNLQLHFVSNEAEALQSDIEQMHENFKKECEAKEFFEKNCDAVYKNVLDIEKVFLRQCAQVPQIEKYYIIGETARTNLDNLKDGVNKLGASKRSLDAYIHSSTPQAYSILQSKLEQLITDYEDVKKGTSDFHIYTETLKTSVEEAFRLVYAYYYRLRICEQQIRESGMEPVKNKYKESVDECYDILNDIQEKIKITPIDITFINEQVEELKTKANALFEDVTRDDNVIRMAESAILIANRDRKHQQEVHQQLINSEKEFFDGDFEKTYHDVVDLIKRTHIEESQAN